MEEELNDIEPISIRDKYTDLLSEWLNSTHKKYKHPGAGHPLHIKTPKELAKIALKFFVECEENNIPITYTGLVLRTKVNSRAALDNYKKKDDFKDLITTIKLIVEDYNVRSLYTDNYRGAQFILKINNSYIETTRTEVVNTSYKIDVTKPKN